MDENCLDEESLDDTEGTGGALHASCELFKKKLAYPYDHFNLGNFQEPLNLTNENFWSTLKQSYPSDEEISRTQEIIKKFDLCY